MADVFLIVMYVLLVIAFGRCGGACHRNHPAAKQQGGKVRAVRKLFAHIFGRSKTASRALPPVSWPPPPMPSLKPSRELGARLNPQMPPKRMPVPRSRSVAAASVPRRSPVAAPAPSVSRSSTTDEGMSMLPSTVWGLDAGSGDDRSAVCRPVIGGGGSFDGGGASGNWDSGSSSSSDSYSSSDSGSSSSSCD